MKPAKRKAMSALRILIADDHEVVRRGVRALLESQPGWEVVADVANGREALETTQRLRPDIVVLDISMPELNGIEATRRILAAVPTTEVIVLTMHESEKLVRRILEAGARGYVSKSDVGGSLIEAVNTVRRHKVFLTSSAATAVVDSYLEIAAGSGRNKSPMELTPRECEVLQLLAEGKTNKEVAARLAISVHTAETHRAKIMRKLGVHSISQLTRYAIRNGLLRA